MDNIKLDPVDVDFVQFIHQLYDHEVWSVINMATDDRTTWVNSPAASARASSKARQIQAALNAGLNVPPTIISNEIDSIREFASKTGKIICKGYAPQLWKDEKGVFSKALTSVVDPSKLRCEDSVRVQPAIYQRYLDKAYEVRALVLDDIVFAIKIDSQMRPETAMDWRRLPLSKSSTTHLELDDDIRNKLICVMKTLGIRMGSFDLVVDPEGMLWFLEVNEAGQFAFIEDICPDLKCLDAFCHLLAFGSLDGWSQQTATLSLTELRRLA